MNFLGDKPPLEWDTIVGVNYLLVLFHGDRDFGLLEWHADPEAFCVGRDSGSEIELCCFEELVVFKAIELVDDKGELGRE